MLASERTRSFVIVGVSPRALAVPADQVSEIVPVAGFAGRLVDLEHLTCGELPNEPRHVLIVLAHGQELGLLVRGRPRLMAVADADVLALPELIARGSRVSHVLAPGGRPLVPVLHLERLDDACEPRAPTAARAIETES
jgi:chemotaxis signal transduction protein